ncbi:hypothetical protein LCGC14_0358000 [marine sediment metagenome]|uniref:Uncharacterized protein n=1 Tax=marine sediment metagenome TaxID=412755 RepID=A0A0F9TEK3_9ZZZZ
MKLQWNKTGDIYFSRKAPGSPKGRFQIFQTETQWNVRDMNFSGVIFATPETLTDAKQAAEKRLIKKIE